MMASGALQIRRLRNFLANLSWQEADISLEGRVGAQRRKRRDLFEA